MATHSSILAWRIPWTEEPGRLQSMGSQASGVRHDLVTKPPPTQLCFKDIKFMANPSKSHGSPCRAREEHFYRRERCQEGYNKQRFYSFSLTESFPGKKRSLSSSWTLIWSQGMRGPCSSLLTLFN